MLKNQKGFSAVVILLALILVAIVGFTGYYVWNTQQDKNDQNKQAAVANTAKQNTANTNQTEKPDTQKYLIIKEWNVKVPLTDKIADATYVVTNGTVYLSTQSLTKKYPECAADKTTVFAYGRYDNPNTPNPNDPSGETTYGQTLPNAPKVGTYYYYGVPPQAGCTMDTSTQDNGYESLSEYRNAFNEAIKNVKAN